MIISSDLTSSDAEMFVRLFVTEIGPLYPFSSEITACAFVESHNRAHEPTGFFTLRKRIWKLTGPAGRVFGFTVASEKLGGSVKFGPTVIVPDERGQGRGRWLRTAVEDVYRRSGARKAYSTTGAGNGSAIAYVMASGYKIEIHLQSHYQAGADELVLGKRLRPAAAPNEVAARPRSEDASLDCVLDILHRWYADIDEDFLTRFSASLKPEVKRTETDFARKSKKIFGRLPGPVAVTVPKRGNCIKLAPIALANDQHANACLLLDIQAYYGEGARKIYTLWPVDQVQQWPQLSALGFLREGLIHSPYRDGEDMFVVSRLNVEG